MKVKKNSIYKHRKHFGTDESCMKYLANQKWSNGFCCRSCKTKEFYKGRLQFDRKCAKCFKNESPTADTMFHGMKIPLSKAFEIIYRLAVNKKGLSCISIAREYDVNQKTATLIRSKIQQAMKSSESHPIAGLVHIDEFFVGGPEEEKQGRTTDSKKKKATIVVEILPNKKGIGRIYAEKIIDFSNTELIKILDKHIKPTAIIVSDKWSGYTPIKAKFPNLVQIKSESGKAFPELHIMIMNLKSWLKGIHHKVSTSCFQKYLDEFVYRFNRRNFIPTIHTNLFKKMATSKLNYSEL